MSFIAIFLTCGNFHSCICCRTPTNYYCGTTCVVVKGLLCDVMKSCCAMYTCHRVVYVDCKNHKCLNH